MACHEGSAVGEQNDIRVFYVQYKALDFEAVLFVRPTNSLRIDRSCSTSILMSARLTTADLDLICGGASLHPKIQALSSSLFEN